MNCMKCGREIEETRVFCEECLAEMGNYPVKPGTVVQLPRRSTAPVAKKAIPKRRQLPSAEEQVARLKKRFRVVLVLWIVTLALLTALAFPLVQELLQEEQLLPGQNYTAVTGTGTTETD